MTWNGSPNRLNKLVKPIVILPTILGVLLAVILCKYALAPIVSVVFINMIHRFQPPDID